MEKGGPLSPSIEMAIELVRIRKAQQYDAHTVPERLTREKPCNTLASVCPAFSNLMRNTSPVIDDGAFVSVPQAPSSHAPSNVATSVTPLSLYSAVALVNLLRMTYRT